MLNNKDNQKGIVSGDSINRNSQRPILIPAIVLAIINSVLWIFAVVGPSECMISSHVDWCRFVEMFLSIPILLISLLIFVIVRRYVRNNKKAWVLIMLIIVFTIFVIPLILRLFDS